MDTHKCGATLMEGPPVDQDKPGQRECRKQKLALGGRHPKPRNAVVGVGTQNGPRYTLRFCRAFDGAHLAKRSERGGWRIGIGPEVIAGEIDMLPTER